jgi:hypothetical protein
MLKAKNAQGENTLKAKKSPAIAGLFVRAWFFSSGLGSETA